jgi:hypothetical protein
MKERFQDTGEGLYQFTDLFLVKCPHCGKCARVLLKEDITGPRPEDTGKPRRPGYILLAPRRLVCAQCGYTRDWAGKKVGSSGLTDYYFQEPLWLQMPCCNEILWAFNERHLDFLEGYVRAELREGHGHGTVASKLPRWIMSAKNREAILHCVEKLREMCREC